NGTFSALASSPDILYHPKPEPSARQCLGLGELLGGAQAESTEIVSTGAGNPKASVARIKVAGRFPACETVSLLSKGRTRTNVERRANDKKSFTAADLEEETADDDDDDDDKDNDDYDDYDDDDDDEREIRQETKQQERQKKKEKEASKKKKQAEEEEKRTDGRDRFAGEHG
ncbi:hypothetical protein ALC57_10071, partial [Trachymyrmex cornetzi]